MLKVLIVDDDSAARTNLKTLIDWERNGFEICGEASNGFTAIQIINSEVPDIVITDMSMPVMDGVALIEYLVQNFPNIKTIALSGYEDFDYVRQSMKNGAVDYLLKHRLNCGLLLNVLKSARENIFRSKDENDKRLKLQEQLFASRSILRQNFITRLVLGGINEMDEIRQKMNEIGMELDTRNLAVAAAQIDDFHFIEGRFSIKEMDKLISSVIDISTEILKDAGRSVIAYLGGGKFAILFSFGDIRSDLYIYNQIITTINRIKTSIKRYLNITACFSVSNIFNDITEVSRHFKEAEAVLMDKFFKGKDKILGKPCESYTGNEFMNLDINDERNITASLKSLDRRKLRDCIDGVFGKIIERKASYKSIYMICAELINIVNRVARECAVDVKMIYSDGDVPYNEIKKYETIMEVKNWILGVYEKLISLLEKLKINPDYNEPTRRAMEFIQKNFAKNISLNDAAEYAGVNSSYLSRVFKEDCGKGFIEYLNLVRVEHAKRLIENGDAKLKEIVKEVGFNSYTYFFKVFKDISGMTPLEYEELCKV
mgnify:CR=1 FL=1